MHASAIHGVTSGGLSRPEMAFTICFKDWKHAAGKGGILNCHSNYAAHKQAAVAWSHYTLNVQQGITISERMGSARTQQIESNHYLKTITDFSSH